MNEPKREAKKIANITSRRGSSSASIVIVAADDGEWKGMLETTMGIIFLMDFSYAMIPYVDSDYEDLTGHA